MTSPTFPDQDHDSSGCGSCATRRSDSPERTCGGAGKCSHESGLADRPDAVARPSLPISSPPPTLLTGAPPAAASTPRQKPASKSLPWTLINFWLDVTLLVGFLLLVWVSCVLHFVFPAGPAGFGWKVLGRTLTDWRNLQFLTLLGLGFGLLLHVMFHWSWICCVIRARLLNRPARDDSGADTLWGVGFLVFLLHLLGAGLLVGWVFKSPV